MTKFSDGEEFEEAIGNTGGGRGDKGPKPSRRLVNSVIFSRAPRGSPSWARRFPRGLDASRTGAPLIERRASTDARPAPRRRRAQFRLAAAAPAKRHAGSMSLPRCPFGPSGAAYGPFGAPTGRLTFHFSLTAGISSANSKNQHKAYVVYRLERYP